MEGQPDLENLAGPEGLVDPEAPVVLGVPAVPRAQRRRGCCCMRRRRSRRGQSEGMDAYADAFQCGMAREKTIGGEFALDDPTTTFVEPGIRFDVLNVSEP